MQGKPAATGNASSATTFSVVLCAMETSNKQIEEEEEISFIPNVPNSFFDEWESSGDEDVEDDNVTPEWSFEVVPSEGDGLGSWSLEPNRDEVELIFIKEDPLTSNPGPVRSLSLDAAEESMGTTSIEQQKILMQVRDANLDTNEEGLEGQHASSNPEHASSIKIPKQAPIHLSFK